MAKSEIRRRDIFASKEEKFWKALKEGWGVVVIGAGTRGFIAYDKSWNANSVEGEDNLREKFANAVFNYEKNAFLVKKEKGKLVWRMKEELNEIKQKKAATILPFKQKPRATHQRVFVIPLWKQKKRFHFSETNGKTVA